MYVITMEWLLYHIANRFFSHLLAHHVDFKNTLLLTKHRQVEHEKNL